GSRRSLFPAPLELESADFLFVANVDSRLARHRRLAASGQREVRAAEPGLGLTRRRASVDVVDVAVVALLGAGQLQHAVAAMLGIDDADAADALVVDGADIGVVAGRAVGLEVVGRAIPGGAGAEVGNVALADIGAAKRARGQV